MEHVLLDDLLRREEITAQTVRETIIACRNAIREHRDARGDDRCWLDDYKVWVFINGLPRVPNVPPPFEEAMQRCYKFYKHRRTDEKDAMPTSGFLTPGDYDGDLVGMDNWRLFEEVRRLQEAIRIHHDITWRPRMVGDDRKLYAVLPEKRAADFRLPLEEDFLGEAKAPHAGCPAFWRSHAQCPVAKHNLHQWGQCTETTL